MYETFFETPGPLFGETLGTFTDEFTLNGTCTPETESTFSFVSRGSAVGPFGAPGNLASFVETGTWTIGPVPPPTPEGGFFNVLATQFETDFTITPNPNDPSPKFERIVGHKSMIPGLAGGACVEAHPAVGTVTYASGLMHYVAEIHLAGGAVIHDEGESRVQVIQQQLFCEKAKDHQDDSKDKCLAKVDKP